MKPKRLLSLVSALLGFGLLLTLRAVAATTPICTVTTPADAGPGSLRTCLQTAKVGTTINFAPTTFPPTTPVTITLDLTLPAIITDHVTIDSSDAWVVLDGHRLPDRDGNSGLRIQGAAGVVIRGLQIVNFPRSGIVVEHGAHNTIIGGDRAIGKGPLGQGNLISRNAFYGILIADDTTHSNHIEGNLIGTDMAGAVDWGNGEAGILIAFCARNNVIGGATPTTRNLISGNDIAGIQIQDACTIGNVIAGNDVGVDHTGTHALGNGMGIAIINSGTNQIGGADKGEYNVISGNGDTGIIMQGPDAVSNRVIGNFIGTDGHGVVAIGNGARGISIYSGASDNLIGGAGAGERNLISGNHKAGIQIEDADTHDNRVFGNFIGSDASGLRAIGNELGIVVWSAYNNHIGGAAPGEGNVISGNQKSGISLQNGAAHNHIVGNRIGTDVEGRVAVSNGEVGIVIGVGASNNRIGGVTAGERNLISGNQKAGIQMQGVDVSGNRIIGNYIGVDGQGAISLCNGRIEQKCVYGIGIVISAGAHHNFIGGVHLGEGNLISGNGLGGIAIRDAGSVGNQIQGNIIGPDASGTRRLVNGQETGIHLTDVQETLIGGPSAGARNLISGHSGDGVFIDDVNSIRNQVQGNYIGVDISGSKVLSNNIGINVLGQENLIGGPGAGNLISGNELWGVSISGNPIYPELHSKSNRVQGNLIGTDASGRRALGNGDGVALGWGAVNNLVGGDTPLERNLISGNHSSGVTITGGNEQSLKQVTDNLVQGNYIGTDLTGQYALGNQFGVLISWQASGNLIGGLAPGEGNVISGNGDTGVAINTYHATNNTLLGNLIGVGSDGVRPLPNGSGLILMGGASQNRVGISNTIAYNHRVGIEVLGVHTTKNEITQNAIFQNDKGQIIISPTLTLSPTLVAYAPISHTVTGQACARCQVELFANPTNQAGGVHYLGVTQADRQGKFVFHLEAAPPECYLTATDTERGTTSPFSAPLDTKR